MMQRKLRTTLAMTMLAALTVLGTASAALAIDPPDNDTAVAGGGNGGTGMDGGAGGAAADCDGVETPADCFSAFAVFDLIP
jgi:hypothetical protein